MSSRRRMYFTALRWVKRVAWLYALLWLLAWTRNPQTRETVFAALSVVAQIVFAIVFVLIQFVAIFWFLARSREETILPGQAGVVTLDDYWGQPKLIEIVGQWVTLLRGVRKFRQMGGQLPKGVLLVGPPGSGKSYLAKAIAGSSGLPFMSMDASSFTNMFLGVGALKVIRFFRKARGLAREYGGAIVFIDEIDAIARSRGGVLQRAVFGNPEPDRAVNGVFMGGGLGGGSYELSTILYEIDGTMEKTRGERILSWLYGLVGAKLPERDWSIFVMAATNIPQAIDPALTRPGRLDRTLPVDKPDFIGRRDIIKGYLGRIQHRTIDLDALTAQTSEMTPAAIKMVVTQEAPRLALFADREEVKMEDISAAVNDVYLGLQNPIRALSDQEKRVIATHEAGHAVLAWLLTDERLNDLSIVRRSGSLGHLLHLPTQDKYLSSYQDLWHRLIVSMGGRAGEIVEFNRLWASTSGDMENNLDVAQKLLHTGFWGTPILTRRQEMEYTRNLFDSAIHHGETLLKKYRKNHKAVMDALLEHESLDHAALELLLGTVGSTRPIEVVAMPKINGRVDA